MFCCVFGSIICLLTLGVELLYPAKESFKNVGNDAGHKQWLSYWVIYFLIFMVEKLTFGILTWIPLYSTVKMLACLWLVHPQYLGASFVHEVILDKIFAIVDEKVKPLFGSKSSQKESLRKED